MPSGEYKALESSQLAVCSPTLCTIAIRVPFPNAPAVDPNFKIDIRDPTTGAVGLNVGQLVDVDAFQRTYRPRPGQSHDEMLVNAHRWVEFVYTKLGSLSAHIEGLNVGRQDLTPRGGLAQALHAFVSGCARPLNVRTRG